MVSTAANDTSGSNLSIVAAYTAPQELHSPHRCAGQLRPELTDRHVKLADVVFLLLQDLSLFLNQSHIAFTDVHLHKFK